MGYVRFCKGANLPSVCAASCGSTPLESSTVVYSSSHSTTGPEGKYQKSVALAAVDVAKADTKSSVRVFYWCPTNN